MALLFIACEEERLPLSFSLVESEVESLSDTSVTLTATVNTSDFSSITRMGFAISLAESDAYDYYDAEISRIISVTIDDLAPDTEYKCIVFVRTEGDGWQQAMDNFRTLPAASEPNEPEQPEDPEDPEQPENPEQPEQPENPEQPEDPEQPEQPIVLETPTLSITNVTATSFVVTWSDIDNADGYEVVTSVSTKTTHSTAYKLENLVEGTYTIKVKALAGDNTQYRDSQYATISQYVEGEKPEEKPAEGMTYRSGWFELPIEVDNNKDGIDDNDDTYYYAHHLCGGSEKNAQRNGRARNYSVCFSSEHHCPVWVAAPRHDMYEGSANRTNAYTQDPQIPSSIQYNRKDADSGCNNGHMLGSAERTSSTETNRQVFYFSNIAPQYSDTFNTGGGAWNNLEDHIDGLVCADTLYTVIGCYFDKYTDKYGNTGSPKKISFGGRSDVSRPTMFYYALLRTKSGRTGKSVAECSASELQCAAFVICHEQDKGHEPQTKDIISIEELERLTGFTYFNNVPNAPKSVVNASDWL